MRFGSVVTAMLMPWLVGPKLAKELLLGADDRVTAERAERIGLVNQVVPRADLMPACEALAEKIAVNGPLAVRFCLEAVQRGLEMTQAEGLFLEATLFSLCCATEDMKEGTRAFLEKRPAQFLGR
ncbi:MAG: hypothetical protein HY653_03210 [Acidobacteria bacterium]|nr:hypothetical protein [Acidobacteriota bacterium]